MLFYIILLILFIRLISSDISKDANKTNYYIWIPIGELLDLPCDPQLVNRVGEIIPYSAAEWYDIGGFYLHTGFILLVKAFTEKYLYGLICNIRDINGFIQHHIEHHVTVYYQPIILWTFKMTLDKSVILENDNLRKIFELKFIRLSDKLNFLCHENEVCYYQFMYFHKSIYQHYLINGAVPNEAIKKNMDKLDGDAVPLTFYFKVGFPQYSALLLDPYSIAYKNYVLGKQEQFSEILEENAIDIFIQQHLFLGGKRSYEMGIELICPSGSEEIVGYITCQKCKSGYYAKPGARCQPCEYGSFQSNRGESHCTICPDLYTTLERASIQEDDCIFDGPLWTAIFVFISRRVWTNVVTSYRTFSIRFLIISFIYVLVSIVVIGWLSYRIHLYRKIKKRRNLAFEQLLSLNTIGNINLDID